MSAPLFLTAAAGHRSAERELASKLTWWQRWLLSRLFRQPRLTALLEERFRARVLHRWGRKMEDANFPLDT